MKYADQLQLLSKKFLSVQDALFAGNKAKARFARNLAMFAVIAAVLASIAQNVQEYYAVKDSNGVEILYPTQRNLDGKLMGQNPAGISPKQKPIAKWTPIGNIDFGGDGTGSKPVNVYKIIKQGDPEWNTSWGAYQIERGAKPGMFWKEWEKLPEQQATSVAIIETHNFGDYLPAPMDVFVENGGTLLPSGKVVIKNKFPRTFHNPIVPRNDSPESLARNKQGATPEGFSKLQSLLSWEKRRRLPTQAFLIAPLDPIKNTLGLFDTLNEQLASGWNPDTNIWNFSLRPTFDKWGLQVKGSPAQHASRPDISCQVFAFQAALELLWSEKEGRTVKLSPSFLRWAHDQFAQNYVGTDTSVGHMAEGIRRYGVCEEGLMSFTERTPSKAALEDATKRTALVTRQVGAMIKPNNNLNENGVYAFPIVEMIRAELNKGRPVLAFGNQLVPTSFGNPILGAFDSRFLKEYRKTGKWPKSGEGALTYTQNGRGDNHGALITGYFATMSGDGDTSPVLEGKQLPAYPKNQGYSYFLELRQAFSADGGDKGHFYTPSSHFGPGLSEFQSLSLD